MSVNRGGVKPFAMPRGMRLSAIDKLPFDEPVSVNTLGLDGDAQFEPRIHGGPFKAVYAYAAEDLAWWSEQLGMRLLPGFIGENLTTAGVDLNGLFAGDELHAGTVVLRVTQGREPCAKLAARIGDPKFVRRFGRAGRLGVYCAVAQPGTLCRDDVITLVPGPRSGPSIRELAAQTFGSDAG